MIGIPIPILSALQKMLMSAAPTFFVTFNHLALSLGLSSTMLTP